MAYPLKRRSFSHIDISAKDAPVIEAVKILPRRPVPAHNSLRRFIRRSYCAASDSRDLGSQVSLDAFIRSCLRLSEMQVILLMMTFLIKLKDAFVGSGCVDIVATLFAARRITPRLSWAAVVRQRRFRPTARVSRSPVDLQRICSSLRVMCLPHSNSCLLDYTGPVEAGQRTPEMA